MAVRLALPWHWRWLLWLTIALVIAIVSRAAYDFGRNFTGLDPGRSAREIESLTAANGKLQQEIAQLRGELAKGERQLQIERATYADLGTQVKTLTEENAAIKEDLAFFQSLMSAGGKSEGVAISRFQVQHDATAGVYRYLLLVTQTGRRNTDFHGSLQLVVSLQKDQKPEIMTLPAESAEGKGFKLGFRFYQRVEGTFRVSTDARIVSLQARVYEDGSTVPKLTQTANTT